MPGTNAIAKDTIIAIGGLGTQADKAENNGGGATKTAWDGGSPSDFIDTNGGPITADTGVTYTNGTTTFSATGIGTGVTVGTLAFVSGTNITTGIYEVTGQTNDTVVMANIVAIGDNTDSVVNVGGAIDLLQNALDGQDGASQNRFIFTNLDETVTAPIDLDTFGGSVLTRISVIGYNAALAAEEQVTITTTSNINSLLQFNNNQIFITIKNITFDGNGKDAGSNATFCVGDTSNANNHISFINCIFHGAGSHGVEMDSDFWTFVNCEAYLNGGVGIDTGSNDGVDNKYFGCSFHDNDSHGVHQFGPRGVFVGCISYDNGGHGFFIDNAGDASELINNTAFGNNSSGFFIGNAANACYVYNNTSVANTVYGYDLNGESYQNLDFFGFNHAAANTGVGGATWYSEDTDANATFADFREGNNQASVQSAANTFVDPSANPPDFTPKTSADIIDTGLTADEGTGT